MSPRAAFVFDRAFTTYQIPDDHPLTPKRLRWTYELLDQYRAFDDADSVLVKPRLAIKEELMTFHTEEYVEAVKRFSKGERLDEQGRFNFSEFGDNPIFPGMYEVSALATGATLVAADLVDSGQVDVAFNIAGGLHHAFPNRASGFCIFNDPVIAINHLLSRDRRVAYVDIDAHHGDGVQEAYYNTSHVLTVSVHESGRYLFPGTGFAADIGEGEGKGYSVNVPLHPYTGDDTYRYAFRQVVLPLLRAFKPDILFTQLGADAYYTDPLTHLQLTTRSYISMLTDFHRLGVPWVAVGGGGYNPGATARCWALDYGVMCGMQWPDEIPDAFKDRLGAARLRDHRVDPVSLDSLKDDAQGYAEAVVAQIKQAVFPIHGLE